MGNEVLGAIGTCKSVLSPDQDDDEVRARWVADAGWPSDEALNKVDRRAWHRSLVRNLHGRGTRHQSNELVNRNGFLLPPIPQPS